MRSHVPLVAAFALAAVLGCQAALAAEMLPYRARYALSLASSDGSNVVAAGGMMLDEWSRTCDGWTEQEHFYLHLDYAEDDVPSGSFDSYSSLVTWEASNGSRFRFDTRRATSDAPFEEIRGEARLRGVTGGGKVVFQQPRSATLPLPPGALFPAAHLRFLIARAEAGDRFVARRVFDGSDVEGAGLITAVIGSRLVPEAGGHDGGAPRSSLLRRSSWPIRLAFFSTDPAVETPEFEESLRLFDDGVVQDMVLDYGDYTIHAKLDQIQSLPSPRC